MLLLFDFNNLRSRLTQTTLCDSVPKIRLAIRRHPASSAAIQNNYPAQKCSRRTWRTFVRRAWFLATKKR